ncbi:hypothetical protein AeRB84_008020, partial [Aphanomyces euteiches]
MLKLFCVVVGEGRPFPVDIAADATVGDLKEKIKEKKPNSIRCDADALRLYLALKGGLQLKDGAWLSDEDPDLEGLSQPAEGNTVLSKYVNEERKMKETKKLSKFFSGGDYPAYCNDEKIHVVVIVPEDTTSAPRQLLAESARVEDKLWLVCGSITNASSIKGVRCRLYRLAGTYLGYYDPARTGKDSALWYEDKTLRIHILFET